VTENLETRLRDALGSAYDLERELPGGGMSRVFVATERALGRTVAVKVLPPDLAAGVNRERFKREIQVAAQLHHPHVVPLLSAGEVGDLLYYTMPYIEGESLGAAIGRRGRLPVRDVIRIMTDVAEALSFAHARGVIHRDIKPGNILMQGSHALVTDFGVAKALSAALPSASGTTSGMVIGTPAYMAPEQLAADPAADHRVDLYALGLVAYEALSGASPRETMANQMTRVPPPVHASNPEVPPALGRIINHCLEKDPALRPPDAAALLAELEALPSSLRQPARSPLAMAGLATLAAVTLGMSGFLLFRALGLNGDRAAAPHLVEADTIPDTVIVRQQAVLTREDSLAIARALAPQRQELQRRGAPEAVLDSLRIAMERAVSDSIARLMVMLRDRGLTQTGPPGPGSVARTPAPGRVATAPATPETAPAGMPAVVFLHFAPVVRTDGALQRALTAARDSLYRTVAAEGAYRMMDLDSLSRGAAEAADVAMTLRNATQVLGRLQAHGADSVVLRITIRPAGWPIGQRTVDVVGTPAPRSNPAALLGPLPEEVGAVLRRVTGSGGRSAGP
jgi:hypothetical protein